MKALLLLLLSASLREMPDGYTYSKALIAAPIGASQENTPNGQNDRLGKLMLQVRREVLLWPWAWFSLTRKGTFHTPSVSLGGAQQNAKVLHAWQS